MNKPPAKTVEDILVDTPHLLESMGTISVSSLTELREQSQAWGEQVTRDNPKAIPELLELAAREMIELTRRLKIDF